MNFFDTLLPIGRTNRAAKDSPATEEQAIALMDRFSVAEAMVFQTAAMESNPDVGNADIAKTVNPRLHRIFAFDPAFTAKLSPDIFLRDAIDRNAKAVLYNPDLGMTRPDKSPSLRKLAGKMEELRMPLIVANRTGMKWYELADFCRDFPKLPVMTWEQRNRHNRPFLDAMALAPNIISVLSSLWQSQMIETIVETFGAERLVFSLGLPFLHPSSFLAVLTYADISEEDKEKIAFGNMRKFLQESKL